MTMLVQGGPPRTSILQPLRRALGNGALIVAAIYVALFALYASTQKGVFAVSEINDLFNNALPLAIAAAGGTFVVLTRGFDLSVGGVVALSNVLMATVVGDGWQGGLAGLVMVLAVGLIVGAFNGFLVAFVGLQSIASTLGTMIVCSGLALIVLDAPGGAVPDFVSYNLTDLVFDAVPVAALAAAALAAIWLVLRRTDFGTALYAIGADETAAGLAGISVARTKFFAYCIAGMLYGVAGYMLSAQTATGNPNSGNAYLLLTFAAIAIGGTAFSGGRGGVIGSMLGAATLTLLQKVLFSTGVSSFYTGIFQGVVMILAVLIAALSARLARGARA
jgi:ribose transport system permease protein